MGLPQKENVESKDFRCPKDFDSQATAFVRGRGVNGNGRQTISDGFGITIGGGGDSRRYLYW